LPTLHRVTLRWLVLLSAATTWACADAPTEPNAVTPRSAAAVHFWDSLATTRWNTRATNLFRTTMPTPPNGQAWASRTLTYLSIAQYRAALAASDPSVRSQRPSVSAAIARASVNMLTYFYTQTPGYSPPATIPAALEQMLVADQSSAAWPGGKNTDEALGNAIGAQVALAVWNQAQADGYNTASTAFATLQTTRPVGAGYWVPPGSPVRSLWGVQPFFLDPTDLVVLPPAPNLAGLEAAALVVLTTITTGSASELAAQVAIANLWNKAPPNGPFTAGEWNQTAVSLIASHKRTELQAARILAYANAAGFDSQIECFATKYTYWVARPAQVNASIVPVFTTPGHPSYPSGHSCISGAFAAALSNSFPDHASSAWLASQVEEAGMSRVYAGIHYMFDISAGQEVGRRAAAAAAGGQLE
jgi:membrane-associated phospholipid phosphatase